MSPSRLRRTLGRLAAASLCVFVSSCESMPSAPEADRLPGSNGDLAIDRLPDLAPSEQPAEDWVETDAFPISRTRVLVSVDPEATVGALNDLLLQLRARIAGASPHGGYLVLEIRPDPAEAPLAGVARARELAESYPGVGAASLETRYELDRLAPAHDTPVVADPCPLQSGSRELADWEWDTLDGGHAWGMKFARVPSAWNLLDRIQRSPALVQAALVDSGFDTGHEDIRFHPSTDTPPAELCGAAHGTEVASVLGARFEVPAQPGTAVGVEGVAPDVEIVGRAARDRAGSFYIDQVVRTLSDFPAVRVVNLSLGASTSYVDGGIRPEVSRSGLFGAIGPTYREIRDQEGHVWTRTLDHLARRTARDFLVTCSAGNAGLLQIGGDWYRYLARDNSACANAAVVWNDPRVLTVEALRPPGDRLADFSTRGGSLAAPGQSVGVATVNDAYVANHGTSFAAPFVAGAAALLWLAAPELTAAEVRRALLEPARRPAQAASVPDPVLPGLEPMDSAPRIDVYGSVLAIAQRRPDLGILLDLADLDDCTLDGSTRTDPPRVCADSRRGDGCVDMGDARAMRDAILEAAQPGTSALEGRADHPGRDLNGDGYLDRILPNAVPSAAGSEETGSRFDLDGDGAVNPLDLVTIRDLWGECREGSGPARLEGWAAGDVLRIRSSADVWIEVPEGGATLFASSGGTPYAVDPAADPDTVRSDGRAPLSVLVPCGRDVDVCATSRLDAGAVRTRCASMSASDPGNDLLAGALPSPLPVPLVFSSSRRAGAGSAAYSLNVALSLDPLDLLAFDESAIMPAISPDGRWVLWAHDGAVRRLSVTDGALSSHVPSAELGAIGEVLPWPTWGDRVEARVVEPPPTVHTPGFQVLFDPSDGTFDTRLGDWNEAELPRLRAPTGLMPGPGGRYFFESRTEDGSYVLAYVALDSPDAEGLCPTAPVEGNVYSTGRPIRLLSAVSSSGLVALLELEGGAWSLRVVDLVTARAILVDESVDEHTFVAWAPDGRALAYSSSDGTIVVSLIESPTAPGGLTTVGVASYTTYGPLGFSPAGDRLLLSDTSVSPGVWRIVGPWDGAAFVSPPNSFSDAAAWSADGSKVAMIGTFTETRTCASVGIYDVTLRDVVLIDAYTGEQTRLTQDWIEHESTCGPVESDERFVAWAATLPAWR